MIMFGILLDFYNTGSSKYNCSYFRPTREEVERQTIHNGFEDQLDKDVWSMTQLKRKSLRDGGQKRDGFIVQLDKGS